MTTSEEVVVQKEEEDIGLCAKEKEAAKLLVEGLMEILEMERKRRDVEWKRAILNLLATVVGVGLLVAVVLVDSRLIRAGLVLLYCAVGFGLNLLGHRLELEEDSG